jgi:hypothetical protein
LKYVSFSFGNGQSGHCSCVQLLPAKRTAVCERLLVAAAAAGP